MPGTAWREVVRSDKLRLRSLIATRDGFMASGCRVDEASNCVQAIVLASPEGEAWTETLVDPDAGLFAPSLVTVGDRYFALGYGHWGAGGGARVWLSSNGTPWSEIVAPSFQDRAVDDIVESPVGTFAIGHEAPIDSDDTSGFLIWPVREDESFGDVRSIDLGADQKLLGGVVWSGEELLAWASPRWTTTETTVLGSRDGRRWTARSAITRPPENSVAEIVPAGDRLVAVGSSGAEFPLRPRAWVSSDDGRSWKVASVEGTDARIFEAAVEAGRLLARGVAPSLDGHPVSWGSNDGTSWTRLPDDQDVPAISGFSSSAPVSVGSVRCVVGTFFDLPVQRGAIYCR